MDRMFLVTRQRTLATHEPNSCLLTILCDVPAKYLRPPCIGRSLVVNHVPPRQTPLMKPAHALSYLVLSSYLPIVPFSLLTNSVRASPFARTLVIAGLCRAGILPL